MTRSKHQFHDTELSGAVEHAYHALAIDERRAPFEPALWFYKPKPGQIIEQKWFCGVHSDIGGGYPERGLSDITLGWMIEKAQGPGLKFDNDALQAYTLHPDPRAMLHNSKTGLYRLTPGSDRPIGLAAKAPGAADDAPSRNDPIQSVHDSVLARWDADASYRPKALKDYFIRIGDRRGKNV